MSAALGKAGADVDALSLQTLHHICLNGEHESARVSAACAILDRGYGKPKQQVEAKLDGSEVFLKVWQAISEGLA